MSLNIREVNKAFCDALGLDPMETVSITFKLAPGHLPYVDIVTRKPLEGIVQIVSEMELRPRGLSDE